MVAAVAMAISFLKMFLSEDKKCSCYHEKV